MVNRQPSTTLEKPRMGERLVLATCLLAVTTACGGRGGDATQPADPAWESGLAQWQQQRDEALRDPDGYLGLAGLFWLSEGTNPIGSLEDAAVHLPSGEVPAQAGRIVLRDAAADLEMAVGVAYTVDGEARVGDGSRFELVPDSTGDATRIGLDRFSFWLIERAGALGIRMRDPESHVLAEFPGVECYPASSGCRVEATYEAFDAPQDVSVPNVLGTNFEDSSPGRLRFELAGRSHVLTPTGADAGSLFLVFGDETNGDGSYGGGRFLKVPPPDADGRLVLDFNRAYNPPCAFSPYTTCPLPTPENRLPLAVEAGERAPRGHP
jgi:uncharacterized protein (DUF1684 family)